MQLKRFSKRLLIFNITIVTIIIVVVVLLVYFVGIKPHGQSGSNSSSGADGTVSFDQSNTGATGGGGLDIDSKVALALGIPSLFVSIISLYIANRQLKDARQSMIQQIANRRDAARDIEIGVKHNGDVISELGMSQAEPAPSPAPSENTQELLGNTIAEMGITINERNTEG